MHAHADEILRAGRDVEIHQRFRIELLRLPEWNDVLVAELGRVAVVLEVMGVVRMAGHVHPAGIPVASSAERPAAPSAPRCRTSRRETIAAPDRFSATPRSAETDRAAMGSCSGRRGAGPAWSAERLPCLLHCACAPSAAHSGVPNRTRLVTMDLLLVDAARELPGDCYQRGG